MEKSYTKFIASFQTEPFHKGRRYHWTICRVDNAEELVSWGHEPTRPLAEAAAEKEIQALSCRMTQGGEVTSRMKPSPLRIPHAVAGK
jgi:hypothetical protein